MDGRRLPARSLHAALRRAGSVFAVAALGALAAGCTAREIGRAALSGEAESVEEWVGDPVALTTVKTVAVLPFADRSPEAGFDAMAFSTRLANQIASRGKVRVVYPNEMMRKVERKNAAVRRHNADVRRRRLLGITAREEAEKQVERDRVRGRETIGAEADVLQEAIDPVHDLDDAVRLAREMKADAVVIGTVADFDPYMRPRMSLTMRVVATGTTDAAALELAELTQWGIPRRKTVARGVIWFRQQNFDAAHGAIGREVKLHALTRHTEHHPYDTEIYLRSTDSYFEFVSAVLAKAMLQAREEALCEAERRAVEEARRRRETAEAMRRRLRDLTDPDPVLPDPDRVIAENLPDRRARGWRPDVYHRAHPQKAADAYRRPRDPAAAW